MAEGILLVLLASGIGAYALGRITGKNSANQVYETNIDWRKRESVKLDQREHEFKAQLKREFDAERTRLYAEIEEKQTALRIDIAAERHRLQQKSAEERRIAQAEILRQDEHLTAREKAFENSFCSGRKWLAAQIAEIKSARDLPIEQYLISKKHPAPSAAKIVSHVRQEKRELMSKLKFLEYQLKSYEEYFPFLEEYREAILDEVIPLNRNADNLAALETSDPVLRFVSKEEYDKLAPAERNQLALERYSKKSKSPWEVGRQYERYIGYYYESRGWHVVYEGALKGLEDFGRDLICRKDKAIKVVQAKYWHRDKTIREKHIFQLFGTTVLLKKQNPGGSVQAVFCSTTDYSEEAKAVAEELRVNLRVRPFDAAYPMIKCNINPATKKQIYHLPMDQQYDRAVIGAVPGECYVKTCQEAEELGFRRAFKWHGDR